MKNIHPEKDEDMAADTMLPWELQRAISLSDIIIEIRDTTSATDLQVRYRNIHTGVLATAIP